MRELSGNIDALKFNRFVTAVAARPPPEAAESGAMSGARLENFAVSEIMKSYQNAGLEPYLYFCRDRDAKETDVILEGDGKFCPLKIKKSAAPDKRLTRVCGVVDRSRWSAVWAPSAVWQSSSARLTEMI